MAANAQSPGKGALGAQGPAARLASYPVSSLRAGSSDEMEEPLLGQPAEATPTSRVRVQPAAAAGDGGPPLPLTFSPEGGAPSSSLVVSVGEGASKVCA